MFRIVILLPLLFIPFISSDNATNNTSDTGGHTAVSKNNVALVTEKGLLPTDGPDLILPGENPILMTIDRELKINKQKPVKARKGVSIPSSSEEVTNVDITVNKTLKGENKTSEVLLQLNVTNLIKNETTSIKPVTVTKHIKKPTLLSYEKLESSVNMNNDMLPDTKSSSRPVLDQIPSPNQTFETLSSKPDLIMPIVITILIVPAFVVLAYMALKRGKEAWKNRHYKRMDFLLDGMYND